MNKNELLQDFTNICRLKLDLKSKLYPEMVLDRKMIEKTARQVLQTYEKEGDILVELDDLVRSLMNIYTVWISWEGQLVDSEREPWLDEERIQKTKWKYWNRYRQHLLESGMPQGSVESHKSSTLEILGNLNPPEREGRWETRGMVVGYVQSGKTANYAGLICRALDIGYKVIIILAGIHNSLRSQTQERIDEGVLGFDSLNNMVNNARPIGVGLIDRIHPSAGTITTRADDGDFNKTVARNFKISPGGSPLIFVIKKNGVILKNLLEEWVESISLGQKTTEGHTVVPDVPLLVIDDEADYGSIDTRKREMLPGGRVDEEHDPTVINRRIRQLLYSFEKSAYVGYTATPFANILIHPMGEVSGLGEDLFPRDFIRALPVPSDYIGPLQVFGIREKNDMEAPDNEEKEAFESEGLPLVRNADDAIKWIPPKHKKHHLPKYREKDDIPDSLKEAIMSFFLTCATRLARGQLNLHNSMLVHVTRFTNVQNKVAEQIDRHIRGIIRRIEYSDGDRRPTIFEEFEELYVGDFLPTSREMESADLKILPWEQVKPLIKDVVQSLKPIRVINGSSDDILDYRENKDRGLTLVVVGGEKLSRGLTLEGLSVSYFLRNSRMYDTLMQMGRWFGYRPGYRDLCRIYLPSQLERDYIDITRAAEELQGDFADMVAEKKKPLDFGLKVRSHPSLLVTAPSKMRAGTRISISYAGDINETVVFNKSREFIHVNNKTVLDFLSRISNAGPPEKDPSIKLDDGTNVNWHGLRWSGVKAEMVVDFLKKYETHVNNRRVNSSLMANYIDTMTTKHPGCLENWTVFMPSGSGKKRLAFSLPKPLDGVHSMVERSSLDIHNPDDYRIRRLLDPRDEAVDFDAGLWELGLKETTVYWEKNPRRNRVLKTPKIPTGKIIRQIRSETDGLLLLYPLEPDENKADEGRKSPPIFGMGISFPHSTRDEKVEYVVSAMYDYLDYGDEDED